MAEEFSWVGKGVRKGRLMFDGRGRWWFRVSPVVPLRQVLEFC